MVFCVWRPLHAYFAGPLLPSISRSHHPKTDFISFIAAETRQDATQRNARLALASRWAFCIIREPRPCFFKKTGLPLTSWLTLTAALVQTFQTYYHSNPADFLSNRPRAGVSLYWLISTVALHNCPEIGISIQKPYNLGFISFQYVLLSMGSRQIFSLWVIHDLCKKTGGREDSGKDIYIYLNLTSLLYVIYTKIE